MMSTTSPPPPSTSSSVHLNTIPGSTNSNTAGSSSAVNLPVLPSSTEDTLDKIVARVNFYESSVHQLKQELPKYFTSLAEAEKSHLVLSKSLKAVASSEPHALLQYLLFAYANKEEELAQHQQEYRDFATETKDILEIWTKKMIQPMRDVIQDHQSNLKKKNNKDDNNTNNAATSAEVQQALASSSTPVLTDNTATANELLKSLLPIHAKLFEKHRLQEMKALLRQMLIKQLSYHAKALESYSQLLECLSEIEDIEVNNNQSSSQSPQAASQQPRNYKQ